MDKETYQCYYHINTSSALFERIKQNSTRLTKMDTETIANRLFELKLDARGTIRLYYDGILTIYKDFEWCRQPKSPY